MILVGPVFLIQDIFLIAESHIVTDWKAEYEKARDEAVRIFITMPTQISYTQVQH